MLHEGHISLLTKASRKGTILNVGIQSDNSVFAQKGKYPNTLESLRAAAVKSPSLCS